MKKYGLFIVCLLICSVGLSACNYKPKPKQPTIRYQRKLEKYINPTQISGQRQGNSIDLSEGPQLKYDAKFGPKDVNFDIKVVNPYDFK